MGRLPSPLGKCTVLAFTWFAEITYYGLLAIAAGVIVMTVEFDGQLVLPDAILRGTALVALGVILVGIGLRNMYRHRDRR
jgi:hypothetical protein